MHGYNIRSPISWFVVPLSQDALCPFPAGTFQVTYSYDYDNENMCFSDRNSRAVVSTNTLSLSTCADDDTYGTTSL